ncbi:hypothetical protein AALO_G00256620 [Alosa alosa]|uniref:Uncharacterized protein n=1 Tax=Alosa alosa TaxID=278164 RepID=A0AAV6FSB3_9TELE|nr:hypothetical protein AALO_G00256620 [Alosa alosa]
MFQEPFCCTALQRYCLQECSCGGRLDAKATAFEVEHQGRVPSRLADHSLAIARDISKNHGKTKRDAPVGTELTPSPPSISLPARMPTQLLCSRDTTDSQDTEDAASAELVSCSPKESFLPSQRRQRNTEGKHLVFLFDHMVHMQPYHICPIWPEGI